MNELSKILAINARRFYRVAMKREDSFEATYAYSDYSHQAASDLIRHGIESNAPFLVSRFGYSELRALLTFMHVHEKAPDWKKVFSFARGEKVEPWWSENTVKIITHNAGVFPAKIEIIEDFCRLVLQDIPEIDVLGSWLGGEHWVKPLMRKTKFIRFLDFYHFLNKDPWTAALAGKRVLVVHPFSASIQNQYKVKEKIFTGTHTLPDFELITYKTVQSIAGNRPVQFDTWFDALETMKSDIARIDFDVAILGCGAYGMPLAAYIKRDLKRKAIHLGGNTQILFGIKGSRWENDANFNHIFNDYWVRPLSEETPEGHQTIDSKCYW
jgi:hypothetical protein